jgi:phage-related protein
MENEPIRRAVFFENYFHDFINAQTPAVKKKILWTIRIVMTEPQIPSQYFKHLEGTDGLYEIRVQHGSNIFRIFCFFDEGRLVIIANGFQKKTQKTPKSEIKKALKIKQKYEDEK